MEIKIHTQHVHLSEEQKELIHNKIEKLTHLTDRLSDSSSEIKVDLSHEQSRKTEDAYECVLTMFVPHDTLRAEARAESLEASVDEVIEKIKGQIEHYKSKLHHLEDRHS